MTPPTYEDQNVVDGFMLASFHKIVAEAETDSLVQRVAAAAIKLWEERDKARWTAALQDASIHKMQPRFHRLEQLWAAVKLEGQYTEMKRRAITQLMALDLNVPITTEKLDPVV